MSTLYYYIFRRLAMPFIVILITISSLVLLTQSVRILDLIVEKGVGLNIFLYVAALLLPSILHVIMPIAMVLSIGITLQALRQDREIIVLKSIGLCDNEIVKPFLHFAILITLLNYCVSFYLMPSSYRQFKDLSLHFRNNYASLLLQEDVFSTQVENLTVYVGSFLKDGDLEDIFINDFRDQRFEKTVSARKGSIHFENDGNSVLKLENGTVQHRDVETGSFSLVHFERYEMPFDMRMNKLNNFRGFAEDEKFLNELLFSNIGDKAERRRLYAHAHQRIIWPSLNISLGLIVASWLVTRPYNRRQRQRDNLLLLVIVSTFIIAAMILYNISRSNNYFIIAMYINFIVSIALPITWLKINKHDNKLSRA
jgi:lipopolysaccharide export system permease protein